MNRSSEPAFPCECERNEKGEFYPIQTGLSQWKVPGLTIREHFAAMAMQGITASDHSNQFNALQVAEWAVAQADALIAELERTTK